MTRQVLIPADPNATHDVMVSQIAINTDPAAKGYARSVIAQATRVPAGQSGIFHVHKGMSLMITEVEQMPVPTATPEA